VAAAPDPGRRSKVGTQLGAWGNCQVGSTCGGRREADDGQVNVLQAPSGQCDSIREGRLRGQCDWL
jgi:hypothetical protein